MMTRNLLSLKTLLLIALVFCGSTAARAACTTALFYADLKSNFVLNGDPTLFHILSPLTASTTAACSGWQEMVVKIDIPSNCTAAILDVEYEGLPRNWTLNVGDSPTNDGFAGDAGSTVHNAELWILQETLSVANAGGSPGAIDNPLVSEHLSLTDSAMKFLIKDQFVSWGQPYQSVQSPNNKLLFAIPDTTVAAANQRSIYAGLNRVIYNAANNGRTGCGLRRVLLKFQ
jgi:hypothetical protein